MTVLGTAGRWLLRVALCAVAACGPAGSGQQSGSPEAPPVAFDGGATTDAAARIAHGSRLADVLGCRGCHGSGLQGERFYELYASNLTREVVRYSDAALERLLREGVHPTGRPLWGMPSEIFQHLSEPDLTALVAYLRTLTPAGPPTQARLPFEPETRKMIAEGRLMPAGEWVRKTRSTTPPDLGRAHARGRYMAMVTCAECHGPTLDGGGGAPDLIVAGAYTRAEFDRLITTGVANGGRQLGLMAGVAKGRFAKLTRHERDELYAYLKARAERPQ